ncbi:hypothetical protein QBC38DRAFT_464833 [Podospora fimiseda]|uniref:Uncharacterized protein n=1 Tax=Podospora fimiseda TaxID=252190 RepID=A0AAN7BYA7_9PEZI|nr:hypothetical protein QBC38DRAFT_464833 [Podospora fimiseda]
MIKSLEKGNYKCHVDTLLPCINSPIVCFFRFQLLSSSDLHQKQLTNQPATSNTIIMHFAPIPTFDCTKQSSETFPYSNRSNEFAPFNNVVGDQESDDEYSESETYDEDYQIDETIERTEQTAARLFTLELTRPPALRSREANNLAIMLRESKASYEFLDAYQLSTWHWQPVTEEDVAREDSQPPKRTHFYDKLMTFAAEPYTNSYNLRKANNPPVRSRENMSVALFTWSRRPIEREVSQSIGEVFKGVMELAGQIWWDMMKMRYSGDSRIWDVVEQFVEECLQWDDHKEVGTFIPQTTDNDLQHRTRGRHVQRRIFARRLKYFGIEKAEEAIRWGWWDVVDEHWFSYMNSAGDRYTDGKTFDDLLVGTEPIAEWGEEQSLLLEF